MNQLSVSDIDFRHSTTPKWLYTINLCVPGGGSIPATMTVHVGIVLPNEPTYENAVIFSTGQFVINRTRSVSNLDFDKTIQLTSYSVDKTARKRLEETA